MELEQSLVQEFAKAINATKQEPKTETIVYGTTVEQGGKMYVRIDGSEQITPIETTTAVKDGQRVTVMIKNHTAIVTGNLTEPSASVGDVNSLNNKVSEFEKVMAHSITTDDLTALNANINNIKAIVADIEELEVVNAQIESLEAMFAELEYVDATNIDAVNAEIEKLEAMFADITDLSAEELEVVNAEIDNLKAYTADFTYVSAEKLEAVEAKVDSLEVGNLDATYANIDFSNIGKAAMEYFYAESGLIKDVTVGNQTITGELVGVTIRGDRLIGGTVIADKLVIQGEDGLYYKLNFDGGDFLEGEEVPTDSLHGSVITANSITAEKISVTDLVAFDATIGGFKITEDSIYSGVKESVDNTTRGVYLDNDGQIAFGDATNFIKYYYDEETDKYKLAISADSVTIGGGEMSTVSEQLSMESDDINITGNRLTIDSDNFTLDADGRVTSNDITITGGSIEVTAPDREQAQIIVKNTYNGISDGSTELNGSFIRLKDSVGGTILLSPLSTGLYQFSIQSGGDSTNRMEMSNTTLLFTKNVTGGVGTQVSKDGIFTYGSVYSKDYIRAEGELQSTSANGLRIVSGNYGFFIRNDGSQTYFLLTASGDQYGSYNSLRPFTINNSSGAVTMGNVSTSTVTATSGFAVGNASYRAAIRHISCGSAVLTPGSTTSTGVKLLAHSTVKGWYSGATASNTAILVTNGDGAANGVHIEGVTYNNSDASWYVVCDTAPGQAFRVNYVVICW